MFLEGPGLPGRLKKTPRWPEDGLKLGQDELRCVHFGMRWPTMGSLCDKIEQDSAKMSQDGPKVAPRKPRQGPGWPQEGPKMAPTGPQDGPRRPQDGPKMEDKSKMPQDAPT